MAAYCLLLPLALAEEAPAVPPAPTFSWGLAYRARPELRLRPSFEEEPQLDEGEPADLAFVGSRFRASLGANLGHARVATVIQDARRFGMETSTTADEATLDLHQGYLELHDLAKGHFDFRIGRFELAWGSERMIGPAAWLDTARSFDGVRSQYRFSPRFALDAFGAWTRERRTIAVRDQEGSTVYEATNGDAVFGLYSAWSPAAPANLDLYVLARFDAPTTTPLRQLERDRQIASPGARVHGKAGGFEYSAEGGVQFGKADGLCVDPCEDIPTSEHNVHFAWAYAASLRYTLGVPAKPFVGVASDMASGDGDPNDGDSEEFDNFFPSNHGKYGAMDLIGWRNMSDQHAIVGVSPLPTLAITGEVHVLGLQQQYGAWSDAGGTVMDDGDYDLYYATSRDLGVEWDLGVAWKPGGGPVKASGGLSQFLPGPAAVERRGPDSSWWAFFALEVALDGVLPLPSRPTALAPCGGVVPCAS